VSTELADLVVVVYQSDWTLLSLSATISHTYDYGVSARLMERRNAERRRAMGPLPGAVRMPSVEVPSRDPLHLEQQVAVAPGGRYRLESSEGLFEVCDGGHCWDLYGGVAHRRPGLRPGRTFHGLLTPQWLVAWYELQITGTEVVDDRAAVRVSGVPRTPSARHPSRYQSLDRVEVLVDAELGILLRSRQIFEGEILEASELTDVVINPPEAGTSGIFDLPSGVPVEQEEKPFADYQPPSGVGWEVAGAAAGAAANALGFAVRHAPRRKSAWPADDNEPDMPGDALLAASDWELGQPPDDQTINLLHRTGLPAPALTAEVHEWTEVLPAIQKLKAFQEKLPAPLAGIFGPDSLWDALGERAAEERRGHRVATLAARQPGRYRLDYLSGDWNKRYKAIASDGEHTTKLFNDKVAIGPAKKLDTSFACMLEPAWLLTGWKLTVIGPAQVAGREGIHLRATAQRYSLDDADELLARADLVVDEELGVLLRHTSYVGDEPLSRIELRNIRPLGSGTTFRILPGPGMKSVTDSGGPFGDRNMPQPAEAAAQAATLAAAGAVALTGWLEKHRKRRERP
jgi:hypothetical protein